MLALLSSLLIAASAPDLARAQRMYDQARYEAALAALGQSCDAAGDTGKCERLRAFVQVALGRESEALAAFSRLLSADPSATLGDDVAPKLQAMFNDVKRSLRELGGLTLEPVEEAAGGVWKIRLRLPRGIDIGKVQAFVMPSGRDQFDAVTLKADGDFWSADYPPAQGASGPLRYYLEVTLRNKVMLPAGSAGLPKHVGVGPAQRSPLRGGQQGRGGSSDDRDPLAPLFPPAGADTEVGSAGPGIPKWAVWTIIGGVAAVVAGGITAAIIMSRKEDPGTIVVGIQFDEP